MYRLVSAWVGLMMNRVKLNFLLWNNFSFLQKSNDIRPSNALLKFDIMSLIYAALKLFCTSAVLF